MVQVKAVACEISRETGVPLSRWTISELGRYVRERVDVEAKMSDTTIWRWLNEDAIKPWQHRTWICPRASNFLEKAGQILDLYHRIWNGRCLGDEEYALCADEKTSIQARQPKHPTRPPRPGVPTLVKHEYTRLGAWVYLVAMDVHRARFFGRWDRKNGIVAFDKLVSKVMRQCVYRKARRVFLIVDNGTAHRGERAARLRELYPTWSSFMAQYMPVWLNQVEIYFSIVQRKVLTASLSSSLADLAVRLRDFQKHYQAHARPFEW